MLFSDLKGFSKIKNNELKMRLVQFTENDILGQLLNSSNHIYHNTWGDAFYICSDNPLVLAEIALQIRDKIRNKDWKQFGLNESIAVRIALHAQMARVMLTPDGVVSNVIGKGVDKTARIEPITEPNDVICSEAFYQLLVNEEPVNISGIHIGRKALAKNFGQMDLFRLVWAREAPEQKLPAIVTPTLPMPRIKRKSTDREKTDFLYQAFGTIRSYLQEALSQLSNSNPDVEFSLRDITSAKYVCEVYLHGERKNGCKVWIGGHQFGGNGISYSEGSFGLETDGSINEMLQVEDDGSELYLKSFMGGVYGLAQDKMSPEQAAEYLWKRFIKQLE
jgi:class 3 adenylate cyclase